MFCLEHMAAHYVTVHGAKKPRAQVTANVLDDGSKSILASFKFSFPKNDEGWLASSGFSPCLFRTVIGGCYAFTLRKHGDKEIRFAVRLLGRGPPRQRLASAKVRFGSLDGTCVQYLLSRVLSPQERMEDDALCAGAPPAVVRVDPAFLAPALVLNPSTPRQPWDLLVSVLLVFEVVRDSDP